MLEIPRPSLILRTALWSLSSLVACGGDDTPASTDASTETSTTQMPTAPTTESAESSGSTTTTATATDTAADSSSTTETEEGGSDTLVEGCWDREDSIYEYEEPDFEPFACPELPIPCPDVDVRLIPCVDCEPGVEFDTKSMSPEEIAAADASIRCMNGALRDATVGTYRIRATADQGFSGYEVVYTVLDVGAVGSLAYNEDLNSGLREEYRQLHAPDYYDDCAAAADVLVALGCIADMAGIDRDACIDDEPTCP